MAHGEQTQTTRRTFIMQAAAGGAAIGAAGLLGQVLTAQPIPSSVPAEAGPEVSCGEDLMREHGVLRRILLVHDEIGRQIDTRLDYPKETLSSSLGLIQKFIQDYHEKLEEDHIFPLFEKAGQQRVLVKTLLAQHKAGRNLVEQMQAIASAKVQLEADSPKKLRKYLQQFAAMYRPHAAREDTVLFPALHGLVTDKQWDKMGDEFEELEQKLFGKDGFEKNVEQVAQMERAVGIDDLDKFTSET